MSKDQTKTLPSKLYAVEWQDKLHPEHVGFLGNDSVPYIWVENPIDEMIEKSYHIRQRLKVVTYVKEDPNKGVCTCGKCQGYAKLPCGHYPDDWCECENEEESK